MGGMGGVHRGTKVGQPRGILGTQRETGRRFVLPQRARAPPHLVISHLIVSQRPHVGHRAIKPALGAPVFPVAATRRWARGRVSGRGMNATEAGERTAHGDGRRRGRGAAGTSAAGRGAWRQGDSHKWCGLTSASQAKHPGRSERRRRRRRQGSHMESLVPMRFLASSSVSGFGRTLIGGVCCAVWARQCLILTRTH